MLDLVESSALFQAKATEGYKRRMTSRILFCFQGRSSFNSRCLDKILVVKKGEKVSIFNLDLNTVKYNSLFIPPANRMQINRTQPGSGNISVFRQCLREIEGIFKKECLKSFKSFAIPVCLSASCWWRHWWRHSRASLFTSNINNKKNTSTLLLKNKVLVTCKQYSFKLESCLLWIHSLDICNPSHFTQGASFPIHKWFKPIKCINLPILQDQYHVTVSDGVQRWAIVMELLSFSRTTFQIVCSVSGSTCAVGSSVY